MSTKQKDKPKPVTTITLRLTGETGAVGYKATVAIARGDWGHVGQFEYFEARHMTEAIEQALAKLEAIERQPPHVPAIPDDAATPDTETDDEMEFSEDEEEFEDDEDSSAPVSAAADEPDAQPGLI